MRLVALSCLLAVLVGCSDVSSQQEWGPLTVVPPRGGGTDAGTAGTLRISATCVVLQRDDGSTRELVWDSSRASWLGGAIEFANEEERLQLSDGDYVEVGGADIGTVQLDWVHGPHSSCPDTRWLVYDVSLDVRPRHQS